MSVALVDSPPDYDAIAVALEAAIQALRSDPENEFLMADVAALLLPLARKWAWKISISVEDNQEAESMILTHLCELAKPEKFRRINPRTGRPLVGYMTGVDVGPFFGNAAKHKALDILKGRRRAWKRECVIMGPLFNYGAAWLSCAPAQVSNVEMNRFLGTQAAAT